jgi:SAM-dependent methyltransferase
MAEHERRVAEAFDGQAARFEKAPVQTDPAVLDWLVRAADLPDDSLVLDAGCGPGIVSAAFLAAGHRMVGVDLSAAMVERARQRCAGYDGRARFEHRSLFDPVLVGPFDAALSRLVLHHTPDPAAFIRRQAELVKPGGILLLCDHTTDPDARAATWHRELEIDRDRTHTLNLSPGALLDLLATAGLVDLRLRELPFALDFDEWFDRGTPRAAKEDVRRRLLASPVCRGFRPEPLPGGAVRIHGWLATVRGVKR